MKSVWVVVGVIVVAALVLVGLTAVRYNQIVSLNEGITSGWAQVENVLQRRADLVPNLVETVKGYAAHEKELFEQFAIARQLQAGAQNIEGKVRAAKAMDSFLGRLMVVVESYPQLKANENFMRLQDELAGTENRIAVERMRYNEIVRQYNTAVKVFPGNIVAKLFAIQPRDVYFEAEENAVEAPRVEF